MIPPRSAANASPGAPKASSRVSVRSASGSREWANPRSIASPARRPPGCAAIAGPMPADRLARAAPDASRPARPAPITRTKATAGQRRPRRGAATWAMVAPIATSTASWAIPISGWWSVNSWTSPPTTEIHAASAMQTRTSGISSTTRATAPGQWAIDGRRAASGSGSAGAIRRLVAGRRHGRRLRRRPGHDAGAAGWTAARRAEDDVQMARGLPRPVEPADASGQSGRPGLGRVGGRVRAAGEQRRPGSRRARGAGGGRDTVAARGRSRRGPSSPAGSSG